MVASIGLVAVNRLSQAGGCSKDSSRQPVSAQATPCLLLTSSPVQATGSRLERPPSYQASTNAVEHLGLIRCAHVPSASGSTDSLSRTQSVSSLFSGQLAGKVNHPPI
jgi:hypothetical protein